MSAPTVYAKVRAETAELLGFDIDNLPAEQALRLDVVCALRVALDDQAAKLMSGESVDVAKLLSASEALSKLLPAAVLASPPPVDEPDPRQVMFDIYMGMRRRGEIADPTSTFEGRGRLIEELRAKVAALEAAAAGGAPAQSEDEPAAAEPAPAPDNVVPLRASPTAPPKPPPGWSGPIHGVWPPAGASVPAPAAPPTPAPQQSEYVLEPVNEPWRAYSHLFE